MTKPYEYVTDLFQKIREDISHIKHRLFTDEPKLQSSEKPLEYFIDATHVNSDSHKEAGPPQGPVIHARLNLPETIGVKAATEERTKPWKEDRNFILQFAAVAVGGAVALIYACQLGQMIESNRINRESLEYTQRPFLNPRPLKIARIIRQMPNGNVRNVVISVTWQNTGNTPAIRVIKFFDAMEGAEPTEEQFRGQKPLPPEATFVVIPSKTDDDPQTLEQPESFILGDLVNVPPEQRKGGAINHPTFVWGWAAYRDVFPKTKIHVSEFCLRSVSLELLASNPDGPPTVQFQSCHGRGYCIDEQCKDYGEIASLVETP